MRIIPSLAVIAWSVCPIALHAADSASTNPATVARKYNNEELRRIAAGAIGKIGPAAEAAIPSLIAALHDDSGAVALHAAGALGQIGPQAVPALAAAVKDPERQHLAVMILAGMGPAAKPAAKVLGATLASYDGVLSERDHDFARDRLREQAGDTSEG